MWAVLGPARPEEGTTCFRAGLGLYFYSLGWHGTARNFFGPSRPDPFWPEARWAWAVPARPGPIPSTIQDYGVSCVIVRGGRISRCVLAIHEVARTLSPIDAPAARGRTLDRLPDLNAPLLSGTVREHQTQADIPRSTRTRTEF